MTLWTMHVLRASSRRAASVAHAARHRARARRVWIIVRHGRVGVGERRCEGRRRWQHNHYCGWGGRGEQGVRAGLADPRLAVQVHRKAHPRPTDRLPPRGKTVIFTILRPAVPWMRRTRRSKWRGQRRRLDGNTGSIDGALNQNNGYATSIRQAIAAKPDAIVLHGQNCAEVKQPLQDAKNAHIPVFAIVALDCSDPKTPGGPSASLFTGVLQYNEGAKDAGAYFKQIGQQQVAYLADATKGNAKIIRTSFVQTFGLYQKEGQDEALKKCPGCKIVADVPFTGAESAPGGVLTQKFRTVLTQHPEATAVLLNFDSTASSSGLSKAIVDAGRKNQLVVVASEGYKTGLTLMRNQAGLNAMPSYSGKWMAWGMADELNRYFNGKPFVPEGIGLRLVDRTHDDTPAGQDYTPPIDYVAAYKHLWGAS